MASPKTIERMLAFHGFPPDAGDKEINDHLDTAEQAATILRKILLSQPTRQYPIR